MPDYVPIKGRVRTQITVVVNMEHLGDKWLRGLTPKRFRDCTWADYHRHNFCLAEFSAKMWANGRLPSQTCIRAERSYRDDRDMLRLYLEYRDNMRRQNQAP